MNALKNFMNKPLVTPLGIFIAMVISDATLNLKIRKMEEKMDREIEKMQGDIAHANELLDVLYYAQYSPDE